jgi:hypothetical protein
MRTGRGDAAGDSDERAVAGWAWDDMGSKSIGILEDLI